MSAPTRRTVIMVGTESDWTLIGGPCLTVGEDPETPVVPCGPWDEESASRVVLDVLQASYYAGGKLYDDSAAVECNAHELAELLTSDTGVDVIRISERARVHPARVGASPRTIVVLRRGATMQVGLPTLHVAIPDGDLRPAAFAKPLVSERVTRIADAAAALIGAPKLGELTYDIDGPRGLDGYMTPMCHSLAVCGYTVIEVHTEPEDITSDLQDEAVRAERDHTLYPVWTSLTVYDGGL